MIFGAGASYDSIPTYPPGAFIAEGSTFDAYHRPPLANELFANRPMFAKAIQDFSECVPIVPRLRALRNETLEAALQDLQSKAEGYPRGLQQLAAVRFYLQMILWKCGEEWRKVAKGVTNYKALLDQIERMHKKDEPVCLVTFNYDTLLEDALSHFGLPIEAIADYTNRHPFYRVFKLHGSVNWARTVENRIRSEYPNHALFVAHEWIERAAELHITDQYELCGGAHPTTISGGRPAFPAIAIPVERKQHFECPPKLIEELVELLPHVTRVLVVGWRATEEHFLQLLRTNLRPGVQLHVVAGNLKEADEALANIAQALIGRAPAHASTSDQGFTDFIVSGKAERFLEQ